MRLVKNGSHTLQFTAVGQVCITIGALAHCVTVIKSVPY